MLVYAYTLYATVSHHMAILERAESVTSEMLADVGAILDAAVKIDADVCGDVFLTQLRVAEFASPVVRDIGRLDRDGALLCTSTAGRLRQPYAWPAADFVTPSGYEAWPDTPLVLAGGAISAHILRRVDTPLFNVVVPKDILRQRLGLGDGFIVFVRDVDGVLHPMGGWKEAGLKAALATAPLGTGVLRLAGGQVLAGRCGAEVPDICAAMRASLLLPLHQLQIVAIMAVLAIFAGLTLTAATWRVLDKRSRFRRRFQRGFRSERFVNVYQPIVCAETGEIVGAEVLVRWRDENGLIRTPDKFLPHIRHFGWSRALLRFVIDGVLRDFADPGRAVAFSGRRLKLAVNLMPDDFDVAFLTGVFAPLRRRFPDLVISLELTEDEMVSVDRVTACIADLRASGFRMSIDDFGTGYSSLGYLTHLQVDEVKIDRSFIRSVEVGTVRSELVRRVIEIAELLGIRCVVEGVETRAQVDWLLGAGAHEMQGYYFSRPVEAGALVSLLNGDTAVGDPGLPWTADRQLRLTPLDAMREAGAG